MARSNPRDEDRRPAGLLDRLEQIEAERKAKPQKGTGENKEPAHEEPAPGVKKAKRELDLDDVW